MKNAFKSVIDVKPQVISMTTTDFVGNYELAYQRWDRHSSLDVKVKTLKDWFNVTSLDEIPFWKLYKAVKKLNSI
jgi:hypothetical protein